MLLAFVFVATAGAEEAHKPCETAPEGMACVPGGPAVIGSQKKLERPPRTVDISTFYLDKHEVTNGDYARCVEAGACKPLKNQKAKMMQPFLGEKQPAMPADWRRARSYCVWAGKRLPTEFEWEKAARGEKGELYPWGNDAPTCDKASYRECAPKDCKPPRGKSKKHDCAEHATKDVGSFPAGRYGIHDLAGNGYEWTATWATPYTSCGSRCKGRDPLGPCDGALPCPKHDKKVLKGGSWYWPKTSIKGSWRRFSAPDTGDHRLSFRCATSTPYLTRYPPIQKTEQRAQPPAPTKPTDEQLAIFNKVREDDTMKKEPCKEAGRAFLDCRDPRSYVKSNEPRQHLWRPFIENLGGGYVGVGADQQYSFIGLARPEWAWLFDYDPQVIKLHHVYKALILASETPEAFVERFKKKNKKENAALIRDFYKGKKDRWAYRETYLATRGVLLPYLQRGLANHREGDEKFGWLRNKAHYDYVRLMYQQGRIVLRNGDMLAKKCFHDIGTAARKLGVTVRIYYGSNAPELWYFTKQYRKNVHNLPFDDKSVVLQTTSGLRRRMSGKKQGYWHYNVQHGLFQQERLKLRGFNTMRKLIDDHVIGDDRALSVSGLKSE
jgi:formylglycine-generating enzyme required for sulfatase activity